MQGIPQLALSVSVLGSTSDQGFPSLLHGWPTVLWVPFLLLLLNACVVLVVDCGPPRQPCLGGPLVCEGGLSDVSVGAALQGTVSTCNVINVLVADMIHCVM